MRVEWGYLAIFAVVVAALVFFAYAVVRSQGSSVDVTIDALSTGNVQFDLGGVHFRQTGYTPSRFPDGSSRADLILTFPDGTQENVTVLFGGYCYSGDPVTSSTFHRNPTASFSWACGEDHIRVRVV